MHRYLIVTGPLETGNTSGNTVGNESGNAFGASGCQAVDQLVELLAAQGDVVVINAESLAAGAQSGAAASGSAVSHLPFFATSGADAIGTVLADARAHLSVQPVDILFIGLDILAEAGSTYVEAIGRLLQGHAETDVVVMVPESRVRDAVDAVRSGVADYLTFPVSTGDAAKVLERLNRNRIQHSELDYLKDQFWNAEALDVVRTESGVMRQVFGKVRQMAGTKTTVLLTGETGTGKSMLARLIHSHSTRRHAPFVSVHCGAIPDTLIESELFGHEKGAFTGAVKSKAGRFQQANGGTLFLDEVGTISSAMQVKLLNALQEKSIQRVGGDREIPVDVRIIAATNDDLKALCDAGLFRKDLFYRLNVFPIEIPPLRERAEDILRFADVFIRNCNVQLGKRIRGIQPAVLEAFQRYTWPGNVRELENLVERACILEEGEYLSPQSVPHDIIPRQNGNCSGPVDISLPLGTARQNMVDRFEREYLTELLRTTHGRIKEAAHWAGITPRQLNKLMTRHGLRRQTFCENGPRKIKK